MDTEEVLKFCNMDAEAKKKKIKALRCHVDNILDLLQITILSPDHNTWAHWTGSHGACNNLSKHVILTFLLT